MAPLPKAWKSRLVPIVSYGNSGWLLVQWMKKIDWLLERDGFPLTDDPPTAELLSGSLPHHDVGVWLQQLPRLQAAVQEVQGHHGEAPLLGHAALVGVLRLLCIVHYQVGSLGGKQCLLISECTEILLQSCLIL